MPPEIGVAVRARARPAAASVRVPVEGLRTIRLSVETQVVLHAELHDMGRPRNTQQRMLEFVEIPARARRMYPRAGFQTNGTKLDTTSLQILIALTLAGPDGKTLSTLAHDLALDLSTVSHAAKALRVAELIDDAPGNGGRHKPVRVTPTGARTARRYVDIASADVAVDG